MAHDISKSALEELLNCGIRYRKHRIEKIQTPPSITASKGQTVHRVAEAFFRHKKETSENLDLTTCLQIGATVFDQEWKIDDDYQIPTKHLKNFKLSSGFMRGDEPNYLNQLTSDMSELRGIYFAEVVEAIKTWYPVACTITPLFVEHPITLDIPDGRGGSIKLKVIVDLICNFEADGKRIEVLDWKVSGKKKTQLDVNSDIGLICGAIAMHQATGRMPESVGYVNLVTKTTPAKREVKVELNTITTEITKRDVDVMVARLSAGMAAICTGVYLPCPTSNFLCSKDWCPYYADCEFVFQKNTEDDE